MTKRTETQATEQASEKKTVQTRTRTRERTKVATYDKLLKIPEAGSIMLELKSEPFMKKIGGGSAKTPEPRTCINVVDLDTGEMLLWALSTHQEQLIEGLHASHEHLTGLEVELVDTGNHIKRMKVFELYLLS